MTTPSQPAALANSHASSRPASPPPCCTPNDTSHASPSALSLFWRRSTVGEREARNIRIRKAVISRRSFIYHGVSSICSPARRAFSRPSRSSPPKRLPQNRRRSGPRKSCWPAAAEERRRKGPNHPHTRDRKKSNYLMGMMRIDTSRALTTKVKDSKIQILHIIDNNYSTVR